MLHNARPVRRPVPIALASLAVLLTAPAAGHAQAPVLPAATPSISVGDVVAREVNGAAVAASFPVTLSSPALTPVSVSFATRDGSATAPADYTATSGSLTLTPGQTRGTINVPLTDDRTGENAERFEVVLTDPLGAALGRAAGGGTIVDDDAQAVRPAPRITMAVTPTRRGSTLVRGRVLPPAGALVTACSAAQVSVTVSLGGRAVDRRVVELDVACAYRVRLKGRPGRLRVVARFEGSEVLRPVSSRPAALRPY